MSTNAMGLQIGARRVIIISMLVSATSILLAQDAAPPTVDLGTHKPEANIQNPPPSPAPNVPDISQLDEIFRQNSLGKEADERKLHIQWRQLANQAVNDPAVIAAKSVVERAQTDLEKRQRLREYYDSYYGRMRAMAATAEMKAALDTLRQAHQSQLNQPRVRHETDGALPTPTPSRKQRKKKGDHS